MTERRPFPPSPRRLALARQAGLTAASPVVVGAVACAAAVVAAIVLARAAAAKLGGWIAAACGAAGEPALVRELGDAMAMPGGAPAQPSVLSVAGDATSHAIRRPEALAASVLEVAAPLLGAIAIAALVAHFAQTRALWLPRRRIPGAPVIEPARVRWEALHTAAALVIGFVAFGWLWLTAPRLAALLSLEPTLQHGAVAAAAAIASFLAVTAIAWVVLGVFDALVRRTELARALAMTVTEKREDDRIAAADPRWRAHRLALARGPNASDAVARAALLLLGDDVAVAIAWDALRQPVPLRTLTGRGARATQLLGLARRHRVAVHRDAVLASQLVDGEGLVPDAHWARLAEIIAAVQRPHTGRRLSG